MNTVIIAKSVSELLISEYLASYQLEMARNPLLVSFLLREIKIIL